MFATKPKAGMTFAYANAEGAFVIETDGALVRSIPVAPGNGDWDRIANWVESGQATIAAYVPPLPPTPLTLDQIYDDMLTTNRVVKALVLAINDGSLVPGSNKTPAQLRAIIKAKM